MTTTTTTKSAATTITATTIITTITTQNPVFVEGEDNWGFPNMKEYFIDFRSGEYYLEEEYRNALFEIVKNDNIEKDLLKYEISQKRYS